MIFIETGTQKFQFDRLLQEMDRLIETGILQDEVFAQIGAAVYEPKHYRWERFLEAEAVRKYLNEAEIIVTHAGTASIMEALYLEKRVVAVPRYKRYGEHVDDHQTQIASRLSEDGYLEAAMTTESIYGAIERARTGTYRKYENDPQPVFDQLRTWIDEWAK